MLPIKALLLAFIQLTGAVFDLQLEVNSANMPYFDFINYFNKLNRTFRITHYKDLPMRLSNVAPEKGNLATYTYRPKMLKNLPLSFDSREKWPNCPTIKEVYTQGQCGSCWAFGVATTASDRTCIHTNKSIELSVQDFKYCPECFRDNVCEGGDPDAALMYWQTEGLVSTDCKAYNITDLLIDNSDPCKCDDDDINYKRDKHYAALVYSINDDVEQIKAELFHHGPIKASFPVYGDFKLYRTGIYERQFGPLLGFHSVRMLGYGEEAGIPYWLIANSWGDEWGEGGFFRIKHFQDNGAIESCLQTGLPKIY